MKNNSYWYDEWINSNKSKENGILKKITHTLKSLSTEPEEMIEVNDPLFFAGTKLPASDPYFKSPRYLSYQQTLPDDEEDEEVVEFEITPQWAIRRIKEHIEEDTFFIEGVITIDGPTTVYVCHPGRERITIDEMDMFKGLDIKYIYFKDCLYTWEDLEEYRSFS